MSLEIQIVSDLHLEFHADKQKFNLIKPSAPILALLGDTCCMGSDDDFEVFKRFINEVLPKYEHIIIVTGNHEYYYNPANKSMKAGKEHTMDSIDAKLKAYCKATSPKLHFLNNSTLKLTVGKKKYTIVGSTLWSWIPEDMRSKIEKEMSDYKYVYVSDAKTKKVRLLNATDVSQLFAKNIAYIKSQISKAAKTGSKVIMFTHHRPYLMPTYDATTLDVAYMSDCATIIKKPITLWAYGHTHVKDDTTVDGVRLYSMPKGYPKQQTKFDKAATVSI